LLLLLFLLFLLHPVDSRLELPLATSTVTLLVQIGAYGDGLMMFYEAAPLQQRL
jgi:hypothetical protein